MDIKRCKTSLAITDIRAAVPPAPMTILHTARLILRPWRDTDLEPFTALNRDPLVMRFFANRLSRAESLSLAARVRASFTMNGFGLFAVEVPGKVDFAGCVGLSVPRFEAPFTPCTEIAWRLTPSCWGQGLATEAATAVATHAFGPLGLKEIVAFTLPDNLPSRRVMEKLGMTRDPAEDFDHPLLPEGHVMRRHVLYRLQATDPATDQDCLNHST